jgi:hypothetical protein
MVQVFLTQRRRGFLGAGLGFLHPQITDYADFLRRGRCAGLFNLKRAVEPSTLFGFKVSWFHPNRDRDRYRDRLFNHGTHRTHGKAWHDFS